VGDVSITSLDVVRFVLVVLGGFPDPAVNFPVLDVICPLLTTAPPRSLPAPFLTLAFDWIFRSSAPQSVREKVLTAINDGIISDDNVRALKARGGFVSVLGPQYLPEGNFEKLIPAYILSGEHRRALVPFLAANVRVHAASVQVAILKNLPGLLLTDAAGTLALIAEQFPQSHAANLASIRDELLLRYVYLTQLHEVSPDVYDFDNEAFMLVCKFNPPGALVFLKDIFQHPRFNLEDAKTVSRQFSAGACTMFLTKQTGTADIGPATDAFKDALLDFTELRNNDFWCETDAELGRFTQAEGPLAALDCAIDLVATDHASYEKFLDAFTFPLYHASKKPDSKNLQHTMQLLLTHFLIGLLVHINALDLFGSLLRQAQVFDPAAFRALVELFLRQLDYEYGTAKLVQEMASYAYQDVVRKAFAALGNGMPSDPFGLCNTCGRLLHLTQEPIAVFPCGHSYHGIIACLPQVDKCPLCSEQKAKVPAVADDALVQRVQPRTLTRWIRWFDTILKPNYGGTVSVNAASTYFAQLPVGGGDVAFQTVAPQERPELHFVIPSDDSP
jgi:hypothetical protein